MTTSPSPADEETAQPPVLPGGAEKMPPRFDPSDHREEEALDDAINEWRFEAIVASVRSRHPEYTAIVFDEPGWLIDKLGEPSGYPDTEYFDQYVVGFLDTADQLVRNWPLEQEINQAMKDVYNVQYMLDRFGELLPDLNRAATFQRIGWLTHYKQDEGELAAERAQLEEIRADEGDIRSSIIVQRHNYLSEVPAFISLIESDATPRLEPLAELAAARLRKTDFFHARSRIATAVVAAAVHRFNPQVATIIVGNPYERDFIERSALARDGFRLVASLDATEQWSLDLGDDFGETDGAVMRMYLGNEPLDPLDPYPESLVHDYGPYLVGPPREWAIPNTTLHNNYGVLLTSFRAVDLTGQPSYLAADAGSNNSDPASAAPGSRA
jgi:hypothetical protein